MREVLCFKEENCIQKFKLYDFETLKLATKILQIYREGSKGGKIHRQSIWSENVTGFLGK